MKFSDILKGVEILRRTGGSPEIAGVEYDSRCVGRSSLFLAMRGGTTDGNRYIGRAIEQGAAAIVTDSAGAFDDTAKRFPEIAVAEIAAETGRQAMAALAGNFFGHPEAELALSGVTGTNGKTTTAFLLDAMLNHVSRKTVLVGTIEYHLPLHHANGGRAGDPGAPGQVRSSPHTTPESRDLLALFREGVDLGATEAVMEVSSHALAQGRVYGLPYDVAIFTNLTRDHLDFHGTMEDYFAAKRMLFDGSLGRAPRAAVVNVDDPYGAELVMAARGAGAEILSYGLESGEFRAADVKMTASGMRFRMHTVAGPVDVRTRLTGKVNVYNLLAASAAAHARGLTLEEIASGAEALACVPGRFQTVDAGQPFTVVVDYAHTDDALRNLTALAREFVKGTGGRVITLFGCGGDRDRAKRPLMGRAAGEGSDFVVLTSDNPRSEEPAAIIADALPGLRETGVEFVTETDRGRGIQRALEAAKAGDIVLLAGKGHEKTQTLREGTVPFDDAEVAARLLRAHQASGVRA
ncbi:UDP-N-acetylmuramoyl-L-alanyl-D-glutamate--2,6-diaminopimelate ligase [Paracidobacterium acidisoli]|uniref:UDP-N-acetylmuramoyl-L-alanyl-D-glutamate--2,6-diaminopimelate ligase n=1 Tax=Paracidobacterium acidisoli TaxID=2303751 RepID=A0A372IKX8_9BACT|nr:UDP-N-acetylmuramoyl-L-alanyl-D-glutamate--2,6-diaminopimelate ligase [Paracidobacterium acidisoli]MBT9332935.1 UDP-N-acetylmuramoyl-L-alanyl-D-glutamate--2,6-diaminopimelate ligase [Paracidobacterium acidisoli]